MSKGEYEDETVKKWYEAAVAHPCFCLVMCIKELTKIGELLNLNNANRWNKMMMMMTMMMMTMMMMAKVEEHEEQEDENKVED